MMMINFLINFLAHCLIYQAIPLPIQGYCAFALVYIIIDRKVPNPFMWAWLFVPVGALWFQGNIFLGILVGLTAFDIVNRKETANEPIS